MNEPSKIGTLEFLIESGKSAFIVFDPRAKGVSVPPHWAVQRQMTLEVGMNLPVPIQALQISHVGVSGMFSFNRAPFYCLVPWSAIVWIGRDFGTDAAVGVFWESSKPADWDDATTTKKVVGTGVNARRRGEKKPGAVAEAMKRGWRVLDGELSGPNTRGAA